MKIKIIDLFNKIYNQEDVPRKIILDNHIWEYLSEYNDYKNEDNDYLFGYYIANYDDVYDFLSKELEIIEEDKKIEKLDNRNYDEINKIYCGKKALGEAEIVDKINEIIDVVNKLVEDNEY